MKSASTPLLRGDPELRQAAEAVLREGESLSSFVARSGDPRQLQHAFVARCLVSRDEAQRTGEYFDAASVHAELRGMLTKSSGGKAKR